MKPDHSGMYSLVWLQARAAARPLGDRLHRSGAVGPGASAGGSESPRSALSGVSFVRRTAPRRAALCSLAVASSQACLCVPSRWVAGCVDGSCACAQVDSERMR